MALVFDVNVVALVIGTVIAQAIGAFWYSPLLFGNKWIKEMKFSKEEVKKMENMSMAKPMFFNLLANLVLVYSIGVILASLGMTNAGLFPGLLLWVGLIATSMLNSVLWEGRSFSMYLINIGHYLVVILAICFTYAMV